MSSADLATLSLLDPDQGVCPNGHPCRLNNRVGERRCSQGEYHGNALICWEITSDGIDGAERGGADGRIVERARAFLSDREDRRRAV
jgi:hypothetical protein